MEHTPIELADLSAAVARVAAPSVAPAGRMMAARGLAPMGPKDLLVALYQLSLDTEANIAQAAKQTAQKLPENILGAGLVEALDARVIDFFSALVLDRDELIEKILLNRATDDSTFVVLAGKLPEAGIELMAGNQIRLLRSPAIIEAIYFNRHARMSTVDRLLELAVRNGLDLHQIPQFEALKANILGTPQQETLVDEQERTVSDSLFASFLGGDDDEGPVDQLEFETAEDKETRMSDMSISEKIRLATLGNSFSRMVLVRDSNRVVAMAAIQSPAIRDQEVVRYAADRGLSEDVIRYIANRREWLKNYQVKLALANNPKTPLPSTLKLLKLLRFSDVRSIARSKSVPAAVAKAAKQATQR